MSTAELARAAGSSSTLMEVDTAEKVAAMAALKRATLLVVSRSGRLA